MTDECHCKPGVFDGRSCIKSCPEGLKRAAHDFGSRIAAVHGETGMMRAATIRDAHHFAGLSQ